MLFRSSQYLVRRKDTVPVMAASSSGPEVAALLRAEEAHISGVFGRIVEFYGRTMRGVLRRPWVLIAGSAAIIVLSYVSYRFLGSDLLPEMDEGGFILDYFTPPGSSLEESNRILLRIEKILRGVPEVENTSRRTGLQLGLEIGRAHV